MRARGRRSRTGLRAVLLLLAVGACTEGRTGPPPARAAAMALPPLPDTQWVRLVASLSEAGGYFDTDNLISNETGYLHVVGALDALGTAGGAYVGVGPDQNFSYIARIRPELAFIVDVRRDNLLQHLLFRALFDLAPTRIEYLALLHGRAPPDDPAAWADATPDELIAWIERAEGGEGTPEEARARARILDVLGRPPVARLLEAEDRRTVERFHHAFVRAGPALRFTSFGRPPRPYYPTLAQLVTARDLEGRQVSYLADEDAYAFVRALHGANRVVPVVGDLGGDHALAAIGREIADRGLMVSALYASNVEFYLWRQGTFDRFARTVAEWPASTSSVLVRSYFPNSRRTHPHAAPGSFSTQTLQTLQSFQRIATTEGWGSYWEVVTREALDPRPAGVR